MNPDQLSRLARAPLETLHLHAYSLETLKTQVPSEAGPHLASNGQAENHETSETPPIRYGWGPDDPS